jgi:hypothetical protein
MNNKAWVASVTGLLVLGAFLGFLHFPEEHALLKRPKPIENPNSQAIVEFEVTYYTYLANISGVVIAGLLALLQLREAHGESWRIWARRSLFCFMIALVLVSIGYSTRTI